MRITKGGAGRVFQCVVVNVMSPALEGSLPATPLTQRKAITVQDSEKVQDF